LRWDQKTAKSALTEEGRAFQAHADMTNNIGQINNNNNTIIYKAP